VTIFKIIINHLKIDTFIYQTHILLIEVPEMEILLIHTQLGPVPPEMIVKTIEIAKELAADTEKFVPGGKLIGSYKAIGQSRVVCLWEVPSIDALTPLLEQMNFMEWETEVIPVETMDVFIAKAEKAVAQMAGA
jgi:hypothetical protein